MKIIQIMPDPNHEYVCLGLGQDSKIYGWSYTRGKWEEYWAKD